MASVSVSILPHPDDQVWRIFFPEAKAESGEHRADEIEQMIEKGED